MAALGTDEHPPDIYRILSKELQLTVENMLPSASDKLCNYRQLLQIQLIHRPL